MHCVLSVTMIREPVEPIDGLGRTHRRVRLFAVDRGRVLSLPAGDHGKGLVNLPQTCVISRPTGATSSEEMASTGANVNSRVWLSGGQRS